MDLDGMDVGSGETLDPVLPKAKAVTLKVRLCSVCKKPGHTKATCKEIAVSIRKVKTNGKTKQQNNLIVACSFLHIVCLLPKILICTAFHKMICLPSEQVSKIILDKDI